MGSMSLTQRLEQLESDLLADPPRISAYSELPCALFRYEPDEEWALRRELQKLATRIQNQGRIVQLVPLSEIVWQAIEGAEGLQPVIELEATRGWEPAQTQVNTYLSDPDFSHLPSVLAGRFDGLDPTPDYVFLWRAAALSPGFYLVSKLLDELKDRLRVPTILFYPGTLNDRDGLRFMGLNDRETMANYRVKIY